MALNYTPILELSLDALTVPNASCTWIDVTNFLLDVEYEDGIQNPGDDPRAGEMTLHLLDRDRRFEPEYKGYIANLIKNPSFEVNLNRWSQAGSGTTTRTRDTTEFLYGIASQKIVTDGAFSGQGANYDDSNNGVLASPGDVWTLSGHFKQVAGGMNAQIAIEWRDAANASISTNNANLVLPANAWTRHSVTATAPANTHHAFCRLRTAASVAVTYFIDGVMMEEAPKLNPYVDGADSNGRWSGTANDSTSYRGGPYYPYIVPNRRFRLRLQNGVGSGTIYTHGIWFVQNWQPEFSGGLYQTSTVKLVDGNGILSGEFLPSLDPPDAESYEDVAGFDDPSFAYALGDKKGTKTVHSIRKKKVKSKGKKGKTHIIKKHRKRVVTRSEAEGTSGPAGTYVNTPGLGEPGLILGDSGTSVFFNENNSEYVKVDLAQEDLISSNRISISAWIKMRSGYTANNAVVSGPNGSGFITCWDLMVTSLGKAVFGVVLAGGGGTDIEAVGTTTLVAGTIYHLAGTWDGSQARVYVNAVLEDAVGGDGSKLLAGSAGGKLGIGCFYGAASPGEFMHGNEQYIYVYEDVLTPERISAHYIAGSARGWNAQLIGDRIEDIVTHSLWDETGIQNGSFTTGPAMKFGQNKLEEIADLVAAEDGLFYFSTASGNPVYLGWDWKSSSSVRYTPQVTFGDSTAGELPFLDADLYYDNQFFNIVTVIGESGKPQTAEDTVSQAKYGVSELPPLEMPLLYDADALDHAQALLARYANPQWVIKSITLTGEDVSVRAQIMLRVLAEMIRVKVKPRGSVGGESSDPIEIVANIIGRKITLEPETGKLVCTFYLDRGLNVGTGLWYAGVAGSSEAGVTTVAA